MKAAEFYKTIKQHIEEAVAKRAPYRAKVSAINEGLVQIQTYDSSTPMLENYSQLAGLKVNPGDEVAVIELGGKPFILGRVKRDLSTKNRFEGAYVIESAASDAFTVVNRDTSEEVFRINAGSGTGIITNHFTIDGTTANRVSLTPPRFQAWSAAASGVASTTSTTVYQTAMTRSYTLPTGTWSVYVVAGQQLRHSADGGIAFRTTIGSSLGSGIVTGFYATNYVQGISTHQISGQSGTIDIAVEYRCSAAGTASSKTPWMFLCAVRTA